MLCVRRRVLFKLRRPSDQLNARRAFSDTPGHDRVGSADIVETEGDKATDLNDSLLGQLKRDLQELHALSKNLPTEKSTQHDPLRADLPTSSEKAFRRHPKRVVSHTLRQREAANRPRQSTRKPGQRLPLLPPCSTKRGKVRGLLSPFDSLPPQDVPIKTPLIPALAHELDRVLTNPGVHWLTDPRTGHDNFPSYLKEVPNTSEFAFERLREFVPSSRDNDLLTLAAKHQCSFAGSTSSLTGMLSQIYLLLAEDKTVDVSTLSAHYQTEAKWFTPGQRMPISVSLRYKNGIYATDSDVDHMSQLGATETVLSQLGTVMEKFFTMKFRAFKEAYLKDSPPPVARKARIEAYRYAIHNKFMMRAQLDCISPLLPGTGVFDIKTRAAVPIRYDLKKYRDNVEDYRIHSIQGPWMSFEKEYYDLIRSAFLKYSFQARIGNMDGVFVAYHNTREIFGFQYIPLEEMDRRLFGHDQGERVFMKCIGLLEVLFSEIVRQFPEQSMNCTWETVSKNHVMRIWVEPAEWQGSDRPVVQLDVKLSHYLGRTKVSGAEAVSSRSGGWTVAYSVTKSTSPREEILKRRRAAFSTQLRVFKYNLSANERVERGQDIDLSHIDPLADADATDSEVPWNRDNAVSLLTGLQQIFGASARPKMRPPSAQEISADEPSTSHPSQGTRE